MEPFTCVDYRGLNKITNKNRYPLPLITEILDRLSGSQVFSKIDLTDAYHRIRVAEGEEWKTTFGTRYGHFEFLVMPFGLTNAPATFQSYIAEVLGDCIDVYTVVYLDDILIFSPDERTNQQHLDTIIKRLTAAELYANPNKCYFFEKEVEFLGFLVNTAGIHMDPARIQTITDWPPIATYRVIQSFIGFCNFYRRFIKNFSTIAQPLTFHLKGMQKGKKPRQFDILAPGHELERQAFDTLKQCFITAPHLKHFDHRRHSRVETDASMHGMGGVFSQLYEEDGKKRWHPVAFYSRKWTDVKYRWQTYDQEMFAIVACFKRWRHYLEGAQHPIRVLSDHFNFKTFMEGKELTAKQVRWLMYLSGFDFQLEHQPGKKNPADSPSRRPDYVQEKRQISPLDFADVQSKLTAARCLKVQIDQVQQDPGEKDIQDPADEDAERAHHAFQTRWPRKEAYPR